MYTVIYTTFDGLQVSQYEDREELLADLDAGRWNSIEFMSIDEWSADRAHNGVIIKGEIVTPKVKTVVEQYDIE